MSILRPIGAVLLVPALLAGCGSNGSSPVTAKAASTTKVEAQRAPALPAKAEKSSQAALPYEIISEKSAIDQNRYAWVTLNQWGFTPNWVRIRLGDTVQIDNRDNVDHWLYLPGMDMGILRPGFTTRVRFTQLGSFTVRDRMGFGSCTVEVR